MTLLEEIMADYEFPQNGNCSFKEALKHIYYNFDMKALQNFMNQVMYLEVTDGEKIFDEDNTEGHQEELKEV